MFSGSKMDGNDRYTFEVSWEVCNKVGGINTVIRSKAKVTVSEIGEKYFLIGPYVEDKMRTQVELQEPEDYFVRSAILAMRDRGIKVVTGRWLIEGNPQVILFDIDSSSNRYSEWMKDFMDVTHIRVPEEDREVVNYVMFGELVTWFLGEFVCRQKGKHTVAHFHEWQAGVGCILARTRGLELGTIFTTHATILGRYLCAGNSDFYNNMPYFDCEGEARRRGIHHKYCIELASCHAAHIFTAVSRITQDEAEHLLKRRPDLITPNGLNLHKFSAMHEFQNLHALAKEKIENFVQGHFYGHLDFDLDKTLYLFSAGRNEYFNKGVDMFLEGLAKLNFYLRRDHVDVTVVAFMIFPEQTTNYNIDSLNGQAQHKKLRESVEKIQHRIGERIFNAVLRGDMPPDKLIDRDDQVLLKNYLYHSKRSALPPIVTHNLSNEEGSEIMNHIKLVKLFNHHHDRVKVIYHPEFLSTTSPLLNIDYSEFVRGCHLGVFPSYYEPWGYTPAECTVMGIPSITTNLSGFGCFMAEHIADPAAYGIYIVDRRFKSPADSTEQLANQMLSFAKQNRRQRIIQRNRTERLSDLMDWESLGLYYVRARHMALKALDVTYQIPSVAQHSDVIDIQQAINDAKANRSPSTPSFSYPRPASQPPSPSHSRRSSVNMDSDEEREDQRMVEDITRRFLEDPNKGRRSSSMQTEAYLPSISQHHPGRRNSSAQTGPTEARTPAVSEHRLEKSHSLGDIMDIRYNVLGDAMGKVKAKQSKQGMLKELQELSAVRPSEQMPLVEVKQRDSLVKGVNREISDISDTKQKKRSLLKEVEDRAETKDNKTVLLQELGKISQIVTGDENVNLVNIQTEKKKKDAALNQISIIGKSKEQKSTMQRELKTISVMRDAKADAMQEIKDRTDTKDKKKGVLEDIGKLKKTKDARNEVLSNINKLGNISANVFAAAKVCEPLPKSFSGHLCVIEEINEIGQLKEQKCEALKELVTTQTSKSNKAVALTELKDISASKCRKEAAMTEIKTRETTKEHKMAALTELKKVADIKEKVVGEMPAGAVEKTIAVHNKAMKDISAIGNQQDAKSEAMREMMTISTAKCSKKHLLGELTQISGARSAKEAAHLELKTISSTRANKDNLQGELLSKSNMAKEDVLAAIQKNGQEREQGIKNVEDHLAGRSTSTVPPVVLRSKIFDEVNLIGKKKEDEHDNLEKMVERQAAEALTRERKAGMLEGIEDLGAKKQEGLDSVEQLMQSKAEKNKAMESIRQIQEDKKEGIINIENMLAKKAAE